MKISSKIILINEWHSLGSGSSCDFLSFFLRPIQILSRIIILCFSLVLGTTFSLNPYMRKGGGVYSVRVRPLPALVFYPLIKKKSTVNTYLKIFYLYQLFVADVSKRQFWNYDLIKTFDVFALKRLFTGFTCRSTEPFSRFEIL